MELKPLTIQSVRSALQKKEFSVAELQAAFLSEIERKNSTLNAYLSVYPPGSAPQLTNEAVLNGIPCALKDNILEFFLRVFV